MMMKCDALKRDVLTEIFFFYLCTKVRYMLLADAIRDISECAIFWCPLSSGRIQGNYKSRASALVFLMIWTMHVYFKVFCHCTDCSSFKSSYFKKRGCVVGIQVQRNLRLVSFTLYVPGLQVPGIPTKRCGVGSFKRLTGPSEGSICQRLPNQKALRDDRSEYRNIERRKQNIGYLPATKTIELCYILVISNPQLL